MIWLYPVVFFVFFLYSFVHTDPNLIYSYHPVFVSVQQALWQFHQEHPKLSSLIYATIISASFGVYLKVVRDINQNGIKPKALIAPLGLSIIILIFSNPALSHDIFNYLFNARMVIEYGANPHLQTALEFSQDAWTRLMHNTHTPAPYGYGWTGLSLIPYLAGFGQFKLTLLTFKLFVGAFFVLLITAQAKIVSLQKNPDYSSWYYFLLNPLVLIETFANGHNDVVMMGLALIGLYWYFTWLKSRQLKFLGYASLAFVASVSIKFASIILPVGLLIWHITKRIRSRIELGSIQSMLHFLPLLTTRSQQFLSWYLIWPLSFLPLTQSTFTKTVLLAFSYSSLMRYIPSLYFPPLNRPLTDGQLRLIEVAITFILAVVLTILTKIFTHRPKASS